ncbi:MAG: TIM barrel protein [Defluviitaleaceae bacterium]|nr:TIM barrel protein [Defluviitaleaceae bacterium]
MFTLTCCGGWLREPDEQKYAAAAKFGFKAVENLLWKELDLAKIRAAIDESGCELSAILIQSRDERKQSLIANEHGMVHEDALDAFVDAIGETLEAAKALNCKNIIVTTGNERDDVPRQVQHDNIVKALKAAAKVVEGSGVTLVLEPLNVLVDHMGYYLTTTAEGVEIIKKVNSPSVKLLYDVYHQQITEGNLINNIRDNIDHIAHIHLGDVPGRKEPGSGEINYKNVLKAIADTGYDKYVVFECGLTEDVETVCKKMWALVS